MAKLNFQEALGDVLADVADSLISDSTLTMVVEILRDRGWRFVLDVDQEVELPADKIG